MEIKKAIIPTAGMGTRFLPLSRAVPKEFFHLVDKPAIQYIFEEAKKSGITDIVFIVSPRQKMLLSYFEKDAELKKILEKRKKENLLKELKDFEDIFEGVSVSFAVQKNPLGDGHSILQGGKKAKPEPVAVFFSDDI